MGKGNPVSSNPLGQFKDEVVSEVKGVVKDTAKQVVQEPKKILESILGKPTTKSENKGDTGIEDLTGGGQQADPQKQQLLMKKMMEDKKRSQDLLRLHRQRLEEEKAYFEQAKQEKEMEEMKEEKEEDEEKKHEIVQLKREKDKNLQLQVQTQGRLGSKEQKSSKF